jgi:CubicO group peptidase (beta-lactamase class C family)
MNSPRRFPPAAALVGMLLTVPTTLAAFPAPPSKAEQAARLLISAPIVPTQYVFADKTFPKFDFQNAAAVEKVIGPYQVHPRFHQGGRSVESAETPGPYLAWVRVDQEKKHLTGRYVTVFRVAAEPGNDWKFQPDHPEELAKLAGVDADLVKKQSRLIGEICKDRPYSQLSKDERFARLLAGLSLMPKGDSNINKQNDALAYERQAWVHARWVYPQETKPRPIDRPLIIKDRPAPVVRAETEAEAGVKPGTADKIDAVLADWASNDDQAFAVCIVRRGVIVLHKAYGARDGKPMTVDTPSWMASITKTMSATCMMMLVDAGEVNLDQPVGNYIHVPAMNEAGKPLLIRNLYTHTSGLARWPGELQRDELPDIEQRARLAVPFSKIGWGFWYGGQGYTLGGKVIESVSGEAMPLFYKKHLLDPLGMKHTEVVGTHADAFSVPLDMARFGQMLLNKGAYGQYRFFSEGTFEKMLPRKLSRELGEDENTPGLRTFGIGLDGQRNKFGHGAASAATFSIDLDRELVVIMTRNRMGKNQDKYNGKFWDAINAGIAKE